MRSTEAEVYFSPNDPESGYLPEGPKELAAPRRGDLCWVNIQRGVNSQNGELFVETQSDLLVQKCPGRPGFVFPDEGKQRAMLGIEKSLVVFDYSSRVFCSLATISDEHPRTIINDAEVVPGGKAIVFGTKDTAFKEPIAALYLYTVDDNRVSLLADKQTCSNGKVIRSDERGLVLFDIDTPTRKVVRYRLDVAARTATPDGVALDLADQIGFPDGMCDCGDGTVIIAFYNPDYADAGKAIRFNLSTGKAIEEWTTPGSPRVTCPLLVKRPEGIKLILTTATEGMPAEMRARCPNAGCLFIADTQLESCPEPEMVSLPTLK